VSHIYEEFNNIYAQTPDRWDFTHKPNVMAVAQNKLSVWFACLLMVPEQR